MLTAVPAPGQNVRVFQLNLKAGELPRDQRVVRVRQGEAIELRLTSDKPIGLHLHGYDIIVSVKPGEASTMAFEARIAGRFSVSSIQPGSAKKEGGGHQHGGRILYLEVYP